MTVEAPPRGIRSVDLSFRPIDLVFWIAVIGVVLANLAVLGPALTSVRLWEDEAFNLTVPLNLLRGLGYSSDGTLSGSTITPFDVRISTGPVVMLPIAGLLALGIEPVLAGRLVGLLGWILLLGSLWLIGRRLGGRWAGLVAAAVPLAYAADPLPSPIQTPIDVLGEVTAAGLLAAALVVLHRRPWLAGLLVGLAIQTKFIALLAVPAFALAALLDAPGSSIWQRVRATLPRVFGAAGLAAAPTFVYEVVKFLSLGPEAGIENLRNFGWFLLGGGQFGYKVPPIDKLNVFIGAWHLPAWVVLGLVALGIMLAVLGAIAVVRRPRLLAEAGASRAGLREFAVVAGVAVLGLVTYLVWWLMSSHTPPWLRHPAPGVLAFLPVAIAAVVVLARVALNAKSWERARPAGGVILRVVTGVLAVAGVAVISVSLVGRIVGHSYGIWETLDDQRAAAADIAEFGYDSLASPWGGGVSVIVMSGAHAGLTDAGRAVAGDPRVWPGEPAEACELMLQSGDYRLCEPPVPAGG
ncbi:hypothetical protein LQ757_18200 [Agromyces sp. SYSU K20354]|uniref:hypothetical protein n=1 Tax=Agromyces cavernae TaxID=2898659 RepID=UPI001E3B5ED8|nr:hypothetical protein [Agromyces cavernae]MCD2444218.1 hypothetical protein [Agromyces cavernae]